VDSPVSDVEKPEFHAQKSRRDAANVVVAPGCLSERKDGTRQLGDTRHPLDRTPERPRPGADAARRRWREDERTVSPDRREARKGRAAVGDQAALSGAGWSQGGRRASSRGHGPATGDADRSHGSGTLGRSTRDGNPIVPSGSAERVRQQRRSRVGRNRETRERRPDFLGRGAPKGVPWPPGGGRASQPEAGRTPGGEQARWSRPGTIGGASALRADPRRQAAVPPGRHAWDLGPARLTPLFIGKFARRRPRTRKRRRCSSHRRRSTDPVAHSARTRRRRGSLELGPAHLTGCG
jgi:hypothetical protein